MYIIKLSEEDLKNISIFLNRTQLQGSEAIALVNIFGQLNQAKKEEKQEEISK